ncbi:putative polysaccharide biosynthesis protein [Niallia sp. 03133]|uniref:putative polysaccharide biosynthesis protein n=1 Tax=Niallia sp. 03133 TaxID=3458060 RepID=UPI004043BB3B
MKPNLQSSDWFKGAFILTIAALITKVLSAVYRIPFQNIVGDTGFYIYQQVYPFYGVVAAVSTYGFPVVLSKLYMELKMEEDSVGLSNLIRSSFILLSCIGMISFCLLFFCAEYVAELMGDPALSKLLKVISFSFLISPFTALMRGIFQGEGSMIPTAVSQVGEQLIRVSTILITALVFTYQGYTLYTIGAGAMFGSITGGLISFLLLFYYYKKVNSNFSYYRPAVYKQRSSRKLYKKLIFEGLTISVSSMLLILMQLADSLNLYAELVSSGVNSDTAKVLKGVYDRGQPLIQMGTILSTSMALTLVPFITGEKIKNNRRKLVEKIQLSLTIGLFIGMGATVGLLSIINETNTMLFENTNGSSVLSILTCIILLNAIIVTSTAILQGLGNPLYPAVIILCSFFIKYGLNSKLVDAYGTIGASIASNITLVIIMLLLLWRLTHVSGSSIINKKSVGVICFGAFIMFLVLKIYLLFTDLCAVGLQHDRLFASFQAMSGVMIGTVIYFFIVIRANVFKKEELILLPFGSKMMVFLPKKRREYSEKH